MMILPAMNCSPILGYFGPILMFAVHSQDTLCLHICVALTHLFVSSPRCSLYCKENMVTLTCNYMVLSMMCWVLRGRAWALMRHNQDACGLHWETGDWVSLVTHNALCCLHQQDTASLSIVKKCLMPLYCTSSP